MTTTKRTAAQQIFRAIGTAGVGLGLALAAPAVADAEPIWDIGVYDSCIDKADNDFIAGVITDDEYADQRVRCCVNSGGVWIGGPVTGKCAAPPPRQADTAPIAPGGTAGVADEPTPLPTANPKPHSSERQNRRARLARRFFRRSVSCSARTACGTPGPCR